MTHVSKVCSTRGFGTLDPIFIVLYLFTDMLFGHCFNFPCTDFCLSTCVYVHYVSVLCSVSIDLSISFRMLPSQLHQWITATNAEFIEHLLIQKCEEHISLCLWLYLFGVYMCILHAGLASAWECCSNYVTCSIATLCLQLRSGVGRLVLESGLQNVKGGDVVI